jgi:hypothetical protein
MTDPLDVAAGDDRPRPILLGEAPSRAGDRYHAFPLSGRPARVLCELAGIPPQEEGSTYGRWTWALYERFECRNLFERYADATPWSAPRAREAARVALAAAQAGAAVTAAVDLATVDPAAALATTPTVIVCLGRRVQAAVFGALDGDIARPLRTRPGAWNTGVFGDFGVWASPWSIHTPVVRPTCRHCGEQRAFREAQCLVGVGGHEYEDRREQRWAPWVVTIPHPSGLNRLLNDEATRARCGAVLTRALVLTDDDGEVSAWA